MKWTMKELNKEKKKKNIKARATEDKFRDTRLRSGGQSKSIVL